MSDVSYKLAEAFVTPASSLVSPSDVSPLSLLTVKQLASYLNVTPGTIYRLVERGELKATRIGRNGRMLRFQREQIQAWLATCNHLTS